MGEIYTGNNITIDTTGNKKAKITKINGGDKQETSVQGKNYFTGNKINSGTKMGVAYSFNNSTLHLNGTTTANGNIVLDKTTKIKIPAGTYTYTIKQNSGTFERPTGNDFAIYLMSGSNNFITGDYANSGISGSNLTNNSGLYSKTFTITEEKELYIRISGSVSGIVFNNLELEIQIESGSTYTGMEQFIPNSPSPDYPSKVETVGSNINLFNKDDMDVIEGAFINSSTKKIETNVNRKCFYLKISPNKTYTISREKIASNFVVGTTAETPIIGSDIIDVDFNNNEIITITASSNANYLVCYYKTNASDVEDEIVKKIKIEEDDKATAYSPYNMGSVEIDVCNKNLAKINEEKFELTNTNTIKYLGVNSGEILTKFNMKAGQNIKFGFKLIKKPTKSTTLSVYDNGSTISDISFSNIQNYEINQIYEKSYTPTVDTEIMVKSWGNASNETIEFQFWAELNELTEYVPYQSQSKILPIQQEMLEGDYIEDVEHHGWNKKILTGNESYGFAETSVQPFRLNLSDAEQLTTSQDIAPNVYCSHFTPVAWNSSKDKLDAWTTALVGTQLAFEYREITTLEDWKAWLQEQYNSGNPVIVYYKLAIPLELELTPEQSNVAYQLENIELFDGINYITTTSSIDPELEVTVENPVEDYKIQISSDGHLIIPELNIKYLIDLNESNIPIMPEATESSVRAAGRDGDIVLNTTYEPITFDIVCYTEDNLTYSEKINAEKNMNRFLNSIKNKTIEIAFEKNNSFYKVKYSGALVTTNFPKHLKFAIPLKSSDSYGKDLIQKSIVGNATGESNTIEEVGAVFVIKGPALNPIISLNDYSMEYTTSILEGARVEIDSNKSTITNINNDGVKTNVMKYYNHQFPKIQNGTNTLKILSGIDNDKNVIVMWNDLKL